MINIVKISLVFLTYLSSVCAIFRETCQLMMANTKAILKDRFCE